MDHSEKLNALCEEAPHSHLKIRMKLNCLQWSWLMGILEECILHYWLCFFLLKQSHQILYGRWLLLSNKMLLCSYRHLLLYKECNIDLVHLTDIHQDNYQRIDRYQWYSTVNLKDISVHIVLHYLSLYTKTYYIW